MFRRLQSMFGDVAESRASEPRLSRSSEPGRSSRSGLAGLRGLPGRSGLAERSGVAGRSGLAGRCLPFLALLALISAAAGCSGESADDWGFTDLDAAMQPLREDFEAGFGSTRVMAVVSPTCGSCLENCEQIYGNIDWFEENGVEVVFVWGAPMPTDTHLRCQEAVDRFPSDYIQHYYDNTGRTTRAFGRMLGTEGAQNIYDVFVVYGPNATWDPQGTMGDEPKDFSVAKTEWAPGLPNVLFSGNVNRIALDQFSLTALMAAVEPMLR